MSVPETIIADVQGNNILLFVVLILLFIIGYKLLQTVLRLGLIAVMSGLFLVALDVIGIGPGVTVDRFILFMVLGTGLFILYSSIAMLFSLLQHTTGFTSDLIQWAFKPVKTEKRLVHRLGAAAKQKRDALKHRTRETAGGTSKEKAIILGEVDDNEE